MTLHTGRFFALLIAACLLSFASCEDGRKVDSPALDGMGLVDMSLSSEIIVRSIENRSDEYLDYNFRYVGVGDYGTSDYYRYGDVVWPMAWYFGRFVAQVESCTADEAEQGRGCVRYEGFSSPFNVINGETTRVVDIECGVANYRVSVIFEDAMFISFKDFRLDVTSVTAPECDEDGLEISPETPVRTLEYDALNLSGYYNLHGTRMNLKYTLYVKAFGAEEFVEQQSGYYVNSGETEPAVVNAADAITFRVGYTGDAVVVPGVMFIVSGERTDVIDNSITIKDYENGDIREDE